MNDEIKELWLEVYRSQLMIQALINGLNRFIKPDVLIDERDIALVEKTAAKLLREKTEPQEGNHAPQERLLKESHIREHQDRNARREASKTKYSDSNEQGGEEP